jgi:hypothetical protein
MPSGIEEAVVESEKPKKSRALEVRVVFEPSRIAPACVAQAYERVVPTVRRGISLGEARRETGREETGRRPGAAR